METLFSRHRNMVVLIAVLFAQLILLAWQIRRPESEVPLIRSWVQALVSPPQRAVSAALEAVHHTWVNYAALRGVREQNRGLEEELNRERILNHQLRGQAQELERLRSLVKFRDESPSTFVAARIIGSGATDTSRVVFLNKGQEDGLKPNMAVITPDGVVGKVQRVFRNSTQVLLITDAESGVGSLLDGSRIHGVLKGQNAYDCQLRFVLNDEKVEVGERVFTSGEDRVYPKGLPVGVVSGVRPGNIFKEITVQPYARFNRLEEVLVVLRGVDSEVPGAPAAAPAATANVEPFPFPIGPAPPPAGPGTEPSQQPEAQPVSPSSNNETYRPGIPRGSRPETDADRLREMYRQRTAEQVRKTAPPPTPKPAVPPTQP